MRNIRKTGLALAATAVLSIAAVGCGSDNSSKNDQAGASQTGIESPASSASASASPTQAAAKKKMTFYGKIVEYTSGEKMVDAMQEKLKDKYDIESIQVDWANLEKVVKTGIASGSPADVYEFWPQNMKTFVSAQQALDLTPYLEANGGEWKNTFNQTLLDLGKFDGKYYAVPLGSNFSVIYVNKDIFDKAGVQVPTEWTWDQFVSASKEIKDKTGVYPFAIGKDLQNWLARNGILSLGASEDKLDALAAGQVPATDPIFSTVLKNIKDLYNKQYWYPGKGALTISRDEAKAAFYQGKVAMLAEVSANARGIMTEAKDINIAVASWPAMGTKNAVLGGADGLFIPANAADKDASVELLKTYLSADIQKIHADEGYAAANVNVQVSDPVVKSIMDLSGDVQAKEFYNLGPKISDYFDKDLISGYVLGASESDVLGKLEKLRQQSINP